MMVTQQSGHMEVFDDEPVVCLDQSVRNLMQEVASDVPNMAMVARQSCSCLTPVD